MASGVVVADEVVKAFGEVKQGHKYKYVLCKISSDLKSIILEEDNGKVVSSTYDDFLARLPPDEPRYAVYDFHYDLADGGHREDIIFIAWCPDNTPVRKRMLHATSKEAFKKKLDLGSKQFQATDTSDITEDAIMEELKKGKC